ncbi:MAG TPA: hypothetical protein PK867_00695, partial [Pirellulales bacterium]|nr:hypothetical protein [Pirellulales bacterium]
MMLNRFRRASSRVEKKRRKDPARRRPGLQLLERRIVLTADLLATLESYVGHTAGTVQPGEVTVGSASDPMLDLTSPTFTFDGAGNVQISGDAKLFPDETKFTATETTLTGSYNYNSGSLGLSADSAEFKVGNILDVTASSPIFTHNNGTWSFSDTSATANSQEFAPNANVSVNGLSITDGGIAFTEADVKNNANLTLDNVLQIDNPDLDVKGFAYTAATGTASASLSAASAGISAASASLFPGNSAFTATVDNFHGGYDFSTNALTLQADDAHIAVGKIIDVKAVSPSFSLDGSGKLTIGVLSATATSPDFPGAEGDVTDLQITDTRISFDEAKITDSNNLTLDDVLQVDGFKLDVQGFTYTTANGLSVSDAAISAASASLFPGNSAFTAT